MTSDCHAVNFLDSVAEIFRRTGGPWLLPLYMDLRVFSLASHCETYRKRYKDQKETTAKT